MTPDDIRNIPVGESTEFKFGKELVDEDLHFNLTDFSWKCRSVSDELQFQLVTILRTIRNMRDMHNETNNPRPEFIVTTRIDAEFSYGGDIGYKGVVKVERLK